jgi:hypothetical protein
VRFSTVIILHGVAKNHHPVSGVIGLADPPGSICRIFALIGCDWLNRRPSTIGELLEKRGIPDNSGVVMYLCEKCNPPATVLDGRYQRKIEQIENLFLLICMPSCACENT